MRWSLCSHAEGIAPALRWTTLTGKPLVQRRLEDGSRIRSFLDGRFDLLPMRKNPSRNSVSHRLAVPIRHGGFLDDGGPSRAEPEPSVSVHGCEDSHASPIS